MHRTNHTKSKQQQPPLEAVADDVSNTEEPQIVARPWPRKEPKENSFAMSKVNVKIARGHSENYF